MQLSQWVQVPQEKQRAASASACSMASPSCTSPLCARRSGGRQASLGRAHGHRVVVQVDVVQRDQCFFGRIGGAIVAGEAAIDRQRGPLAHADGLGDEARHARQVAAGPDACRRWWRRGIDLEQGIAGFERGERRELGVLADRADDRVGASERIHCSAMRRHLELAALRTGLELHAHAVQVHAGAVVRFRCTPRSIAEFSSVMPSSRASITSSGCAGIWSSASSARIVTSWPARRALRAASSAALPPPMTTTCRPSAGARATAAAREVVGAVDDPVPLVVELRQALRLLGAERQVDGVVLGAQLGEVFGARQGLAAAHVDAERQDASDLAVEHVARQPVGRNAVAHQAAEFGLRLDQRDAVAAAAQLERGRQARGPAADDGDALAALAVGQRRTTSLVRAPRHRRSVRACRSPAPRRSRRGCTRSRTGGGRCGRRSPGTGCGASASPTRRGSRARARGRSTRRSRRRPGRPRGTARARGCAAPARRARCRS